MRCMKCRERASISDPNRRPEAFSTRGELGPAFDKPAAGLPQRRCGHFIPRALRPVIHRKTHMTAPLILASASPIRAELLRRAGVAVEALPARVDEAAIRAALEAEGVRPRDLADTLAEMKARKIADRHPARWVLGCDQVLDLGGVVFAKPDTPDAARAQLQALRGKSHKLLSAAVLYEAGLPVWRHVGEVRLTMRVFSDAYLDDYIARLWPGIGESVGAYKLEGEGVRLFDRIEGDYFNILGLQLIELLRYLGQRGVIAA